MRGQHRAGARAVPVNLVPAVKQVLVGELLQQPPHRFDVAVVVGDVGLFQVHPVADAGGQLVPQRGVLVDRLAAGGVVLGDAEGLDVGAVLQPQRFFDLDLHRQAVGVPAGLALHAVAAHGLVAAEAVLDGARQHVVHAGAAVGRGRPFIKGEAGRVGPVGELGREDLLTLPVVEDAALELRGGEVGGSKLGKSAHGRGKRPDSTASGPALRCTASFNPVEFAPDSPAHQRP